MAGVITTTITNLMNEIVPQVLVDAVERKTQLYNFFAKPNGIGGSAYKWKVNSAGNTSASSFGEGEPEQAAGKQTDVPASLTWRQHRIIMRLSNSSIEDASGNAYMLGNLVENEVSRAFLDLMENLDDAIQSDGTGNSSKDITGLLAAISATGTYATIDRSTSTFWQSHATGTVGTLTELDVQTTLLNLRSTTRKGVPTHILCGSTVFNIFGNLIDANRRPVVSQSDGKSGLHFNGGFTSLSYAGVEVLEVPGYTAQRMDVIQYGDWKLPEVRKFKMKDWREEDDDITTALSWRGQLACEHPGRQGTLTGITG